MNLNHTLLSCSLIILLNTCFGQSHEKSLFLARSLDIEFNGSDECFRFLETQAISPSTGRMMGSAIELVFIDDTLSAAFNWAGAYRLKRDLKKNEVGLKYVDVQPHQIYKLEVAMNAASYLGGPPPDGFNMPKFEFIAPFQYLGKCAKTDEAFAWLPFDLHLTAPIFLDFDMLFIDYSDPMNPVVVNREELAKTGTAYDELRPDSEVVFNKVFFKALKSNYYGRNFGNAGIPDWIQYPIIPKCPKSHKTMKFVCQLMSNREIKTERTNVELKEAYQKRYFDHLNFWIDGDLYIFFEPESKVACYFIQHT